MEEVVMRFRFHILLALVASSTIYAAADSGPVASVTGGQVRGALLGASGAAFKGIPYAHAPVGALRWQEPAPVVPWTGVRDATTFGPPCAQNPYLRKNAKETSREDCLFLNVWTPAWPANSAKLPVMVWIHGGGNYAGAAGEDTSGDKLIHHGVIVVTFNYRLGLFGFFSHPELSRKSPHHVSGNQGFLDQIAALRWVQENIANFGGDPANVTIFGESAGSFNVSVLATSPLSRGLFGRIIGESGAVVTAGEPLPLADAEKRDLALAATWTAEGDPSLKRLRALPADAILAKEPNFLAQPQPNLGLVVDGYVFTEPPEDAFSAGREQRVDTLHGSLAHEWFGIQPPADLNQAIDASYPSDIAKRARTLYQTSGTDPLYGTPAEQWAEDFSFRCPSVAQLTSHAVAGNRAYEFQFDRLPPGFDKSRNAHHQEVQYVFGLGPEKFEASDYALSDAMQEYWTNFAKTGDPNGTGKLPNWPRFDPASKSFMEFTDAGPVVRKDLRGKFCELWIETEKQSRKDR
jgi:para-nitrobenzyl esterase